jgi:iron(III) transport system permease protein
VVTGVLVVLLILPLLELVDATFTWSEADVRLDPTVPPGSRTFLHWKRTFASSVSWSAFYAPLLNSLATGLASASIAMILGTSLAWLVARTNLPGGGGLRTVAVLPYIMPSWTLALAWLAAFRTDAMGGGSLYHFLTGHSPPSWLAYGPLPITVVLALHYSPFAFLLLLPAFRQLDATLEEAAEVAGASRIQLWRRVTLPLVRPALLGAFVLTFSRTLGAFATPFLLGAPARYDTLATVLYAHITTGAPAQGYVVALVLVAISALAVSGGQRALGARRGYATVGGRGVRPRGLDLGRWRAPAGAVVWALVLATVGAPLVLLLWESLMKYPDDYSLRNLTAHFWIGPSRPPLADGEPGILRNRLILTAAANSVRLAVSVAGVTALAGFLLATFLVRHRGRPIGHVVEQLTSLPYLVPSVAFGAMYLSVALRPWGPLPPLYGTFLLLVLVCVLKYLPFSVRATVAGLLQVSRELDEAAVVCGASLPARLRRVVLPLLAPTILSGAVLAFVSAMRELSLILLLTTPPHRTLTMTTFRYTEQGLPQFADAIILLLVVLTVLGELAARALERWSSRRGVPRGAG